MAGGGIFATTAVSLAAFGFSIATFVWSRRIDREIDTYPYGDVIELPRETVAGHNQRGGGITDHRRMRTVARGTSLTHSDRGL